MLPQSHPHRATPAGEVAGAARGDEREPLVATTGKQKEDHQMLSEIYGWFTEGFRTKDLQEARMRIEELKD